MISDTLEELGFDADHTPVDVLMSQPLGVALAVAHSMEYGDDEIPGEE